MAYTPSGPYTDNEPPGLTAEALNAMESFLESVNSAATDGSVSSASGVMTLLGLIANGAIQPNPTSHLLNGATSGTATLWQPFTGTFKLIVIIENNMRNGTGGPQNITFPTAFTNMAWVMCGNTNAFNLLSGGSSVATQNMTAFGTLTGGSSIGSASFNQVPACDTISFLGGQSSTHTGIIIMSGI